MPGKPRVTERDIAVLKDLQSGVALRMNQLEKHFESTTKAKYKRMRILMERGYVRRDGHYYMITSKGIKVITGEESTPLKISKPYQRTHRSKLADIYLALHNKGWEWFNSSDVKKLYNLNRTSRVEGMLRNMITGEDYSVYLLSNRPTSKTISGIKSSIKSHTRDGLYKVIVFVPNGVAAEAFGTDPYQLVDLDCMALHLVHASMDGFNTLKETANPDWFLNAPGYPFLGDTPDDFIDKNKLLNQEITVAFADALVAYNNQEYYVCELITQDAIKLYHLLKYTEDQAEAQGRKVILLVLEPQYEKNLERFKAYPHIEIAPIPFAWLHAK